MDETVLSKQVHTTHGSWLSVTPYIQKYFFALDLMFLRFVLSRLVRGFLVFNFINVAVNAYKALQWLFRMIFNLETFELHFHNVIDENLSGMFST